MGVLWMPGQKATQGQRSRSNVEGSKIQSEKKDQSSKRQTSKDSKGPNNKSSPPNSKKTGNKNLIQISKARNNKETVQKSDSPDGLESSVIVPVKSKNRASKSTGQKHGKPTVDSDPMENSPRV